MPVLEAEAQVYPDDLFEDEKPLVGEPKSWRVLHTRPRAEKTIARMLLSQEISFFLPQGSTRNKTQRRWITTYRPLFPSYLFLYGDDDEYSSALQTNKVVSTIEVQDQARLQHELSQLHLLINQEVPFRTEPQIPNGTPVEIHKGALAGLRGIVVRNDNSSRIIVEVNMINQGVSLQVEEWMLQKI